MGVPLAVRADRSEPRHQADPRRRTGPSKMTSRSPIDFALYLKHLAQVCAAGNYRPLAHNLNRKDCDQNMKNSTVRVKDLNKKESAEKKMFF